MQLDIDFAPRRRWPRPRATALLVLALGCGATALWEWGSAVEEQRALDATLAGAHLKSKQARTGLPPKEIEAINRAVQQLNLPWNALLAAVENHLSDRVALLSLEPDATKQTLRIQAEAKSADAMVEFADDLDDEEIFVAATLTRHEINEGDRNKPYRFTVEAQWQPPS